MNPKLSKACLLLSSTVVALGLLLPSASAQYPTTLDPALNGLGTGFLNSPEVGYLEGIQRFGENLRTDPDVGLGYTYRVLPPVDGNVGMNPESFLWALIHFPEALELKKLYGQLAQKIQERENLLTQGKSTKKEDDDILLLQVQIEKQRLGLSLALGRARPAEFSSRYATGRDTTAGMRNSFSANSRASQPYSLDADGSIGGLGVIQPRGIGVDGTLSAGIGNPPTKKLYHQPLIQIKVRIVEASRLNSSDFRSVLDYISHKGAASNVKANNINNNLQSTRAATRLPVNARTLSETATGGGLEALTGGSGALINLTTEHINYITTMLVNDFRGDVFTVPEVVTLNGQNVEFVAGDKRPFPLGLTLQQGQGTTTQQFFFKHVGTVLSVTPRIVNWGKHLEGRGEAPIVAQEVGNWNRLALWMSDPQNLHAPVLQGELKKYGYSIGPVPREVKTKMLAELEKYPALQLRERFYQFDAPLFEKPIQQMSSQLGGAVTELPPLPVPAGATVQVPVEQDYATAEPDQPILREPTGQACDWKPEDCTIDLEILVRQSNVNVDTPLDKPAENENSIANVVQVKSGHGVVMGGMIGTSEIQAVSKVPLLGDLPVVGYAFRSKSTDRAKTELIILVEASVLPNSSQAREETARDFQLGYDYVSAEFHASPLEIGMHRAGFGAYLPPACPREDEFWTEHGNKMRRMTTEVDDIFK